MDDLRDANLISPRNNDGLCLFYCVFAIIWMRKSPRKIQIEALEQNLKNITPKIAAEVDSIRHECNIRKSQKGYGSIDDLKKIQNFLNTQAGNLRLVVFNTNERKTPDFVGVSKNVEADAGLLCHKGHFYCIKSISTFVGSKYYCADCRSGFSNPSRHNAGCRWIDMLNTFCLILTFRWKCNLCASWGFDMPHKTERLRISCEVCNRIYFNRQCFEIHLNTACHLYKKCLDCDTTWSTRRNIEHVCGEFNCRVCNLNHGERDCFITPIEDKINPDYAICCFDVESTQEHVITSNKLEHHVNFIAAFKFCTLCFETKTWRSKTTNCQFCGKGERMLTWSGLEGENCLKNFMDWLLLGDINTPIICVSHFGGRYDCIFILKEFFNRNMGHLLTLTAMGNKFFQITLKKTKSNPEIKFKDTFNFCAVSLAELVPTFSLNIENKQWFPYLFNTRSNYDVELDHLPDKKYYLPNSMKPKKRDNFLQWYEANYFTPFSLKTQIPIYTINDVVILAEATAEFRRIYIEIFNVDPIWSSITIASACMYSFRKNFLIAKTIAIIPEGGYHRASKASDIALRYFYHRREQTGENIQFHDSPEGEKVIQKYKIDGFIEPDVCIEFNG